MASVTARLRRHLPRSRRESARLTFAPSRKRLSGFRLRGRLIFDRRQRRLRAAVDRNGRKIAEFVSHCERVSRATCAPMLRRRMTMSALIRRPIGSIAFVSALLGLSLGIGLPANTARAADCLTAPDTTATANGHWYYRTDRVNQRKCWYLRAGDEPSEQKDVQTAHETADSTPLQPAPTRKPSADHPNGHLSDKEVAKLYAEFLEWSRHAGYEGEEHQ